MGRKKQKRRLKKLMKALREGGPVPAGRSTMNPDSFPPTPKADPQASTAAIPAVTDAMMEHAAHRAAELADGVAHGTVAVAATARGLFDRAAEAAPEAAEPASAAVDPAPAPAEIIESAVAGLSQASHGVTEAEEAPAVPSAGEVAAAAREAVARTTRASEAALSGSADAFGLYNAKLFEVMRANMAATGSHMAALLQTKSVPEAVALNADHLRRQLDTMTAQGRELATLAQKLTLETLGPLRGLIAPDR